MNDKIKTIDEAIKQIEKQYGKGSIMRLGSDTRLDVEGISTGSLGLDIALGGKGVPRSRVIEIYGPESSGKTTLCLHIAANAQKEGGIAAFIDAENALDPAYSSKIGVDLDNLLLSQPDSGEQALEIAEHLVRTNAVDVIIVDSVAALVPKAELEGNMSDMQIGLQARLMSKALRKLVAAINRSKTCVIFTNQIREKIGVMFGNPETTPGGRALKFYSSVRIEIRRVTSITEGDNIIGNKTRTKVVKNKIAPPFKKAEFDILYNEGISFLGELIDWAVNYEIINKSGSWYSFGDEKLGQGKEKVKEYFRSKPALVTKINKILFSKLGIEMPKPKTESNKTESTKTESTKKKK